MTKLAENNPQGTANIADDRVLAVRIDCKNMDAIDLIMLYEELIVANSRCRKPFKYKDKLEAVYNEVFKRVFEYDR